MKKDFTNVPEGWKNPQQVSKMLTEELGIIIDDRKIRDIIDNENIETVKIPFIENKKDGSTVQKFNTFLDPKSISTIKESEEFKAYCKKKEKRNEFLTSIPTIRHEDNEILKGDAFTFDPGYNFYSKDGCCVVTDVTDDRCTLLPMSPKTKESLYNTGIRCPIRFDSAKEDVLTNGNCIGNIFAVANFILTEKNN